MVTVYKRNALYDKKLNQLSYRYHRAGERLLRLKRRPGRLKEKMKKRPEAWKIPRRFYGPQNIRRKYYFELM